MVDPIRYDVCPACECRVDDRDPSVSCVTVDGVMYHPSCISEYPEGWTAGDEALFQAVANELRQKADEAIAEMNRASLDDMFARIRQSLDQERELQEGFEEWERERIEKATAISDLFASVGLGPEIMEER